MTSAPPPRPTPGPPPGPTPQPTPAPSVSGSDPLEEARQRLAALDERPVHEHPDQFTVIDELLRRALDASGSSPGR